MSLTVSEVACYSRSARLQPGDLAFQVRAVFQQAKQLADAYLEALVPIRSYTTLDGMQGDFAAMAILDDLDQAGALGYHDVDGKKRPFGRCKAAKDPNDATTLSHEFLELARDPGTDLWLPMPDGRSIAYEICDPCQEETYQINVTIGDESRWITVSDFVLPAYFVAGAPGPYSHCDTIDTPFGTARGGGGWRLLKDSSGKVVSDFAGLDPRPTVVAALAARGRDPGSRSYQRGLRA